MPLLSESCIFDRYRTDKTVLYAGQKTIPSRANGKDEKAHLVFCCYRCNNDKVGFDPSEGTINVLVQREMESWRAPLGSITPFSGVGLRSPTAR
jgi:CTP-dependent riboflavin kinase